MKWESGRVKWESGRVKAERVIGRASDSGECVSEWERFEV